MKRKKKAQKGSSGKGWASFRIRGIKTSLGNLKGHEELSAEVCVELHHALIYITNAVKILDKEKGES